MTDINLKIDGSIKSMALKSGDVVVIKLPHNLSAEIVHKLWSEVAPMFPGNKVLVTLDGIEIEVVSPQP